MNKPQRVPLHERGINIDDLTLWPRTLASKPTVSRTGMARVTLPIGAKKDTSKPNT
ncbi:hypothetical protein [Maritalea sp.]|jgi:hypothetical protein|uniref:hypothetical protein n=1 Tax=Maritalea sp. TaxID=2003361 RepID=UPI0039E4C6A8